MILFRHRAEIGCRGWNRTSIRAFKGRCPMVIRLGCMLVPPGTQGVDTDTQITSNVAIGFPAGLGQFHRLLAKGGIIGLVCSWHMEVPCVRLESKLWEHFVKARRKALARENDPASTVEDIKFISCFVPYSDVAFLEIKMTSWLRQSKLWDGHKTELFSLKYRNDEFIQYLTGLEKDHVIPVSPKIFAAFETERLAILRQHNRPMLWICFIPTHPDDLVRLKTVDPQNAPDSLIECSILPGGGIEWLEAIPDTTSISSDQLESLIQKALDRTMAVPREGCHVSMRVHFSLTNCAGMEIKSHSGSQSKKIENDLFRLGISDWLTDSRNLLWPKPDELLPALFISKLPKSRAKGRRISAALSGLG
jgi:hypothetical protein